MHTTWPSGKIQSIGSRFSLENREVKVHSVFHSALNLQDTHGGLSTLVMHKSQMHPSAALVYFTGKSSGFDELAFTQAEKAMVTEAKLAFDCGIWVSCLGANRVHPSEERPPLLPPFGASFLRKQIHILSELQQEKQISLNVEALFSPETATNSITFLVSCNAYLLKKSLQTADDSLAREALAGLLGLGPGATPTGDDFICGFLLALHMLSSLCFDRGLQSYCSSIAKNLSTFLHKKTPLTTDISLQLLGLAAEGLFSQPLIAMAEGFCRLDSDESTWEALSDYGHSSGLDAGLGFLFGLSLLLPDFEYKEEVC